MTMEDMKERNVVKNMVNLKLRIRGDKTDALLVSPF